MASVNVLLEPKTATFQMRISPKVKKNVEKIYANCGMSLTDAINAFLQQSINVGGLPFLMNENSKHSVKALAMAQLFLELKRGEESGEKDGWLSEEVVLKNLGITL